MSILNKIIESTQARVSKLKSKYNHAFFEESVLFHSPVVSLSHYLKKPGKNGIIAEFKRCSPSKGMLNPYADVAETTVGYMRSGCSALSVLTEPEFFKGSNEDLISARKFNYCPILRKDFIVDPIQVYESRAIGADAILLIAKILSKDRIEELTACAHLLGLEVFMEVDDEKGIEKLSSVHTLVGINSRNLSDMKEDLSATTILRTKITGERLVVAESGILFPEQVNRLRLNGFDGFLIGTAFMRNSDPAKSCMDFCKSLSLQDQIQLLQS